VHAENRVQLQSTEGRGLRGVCGAGEGMKIFTGTSWNEDNIQKCIEYGIGWCTSPQDPVQPKDISPEIEYIFDNGAFFAFKKGVPFNTPLFYTQLGKIEREPYFVSVPDIVGGGLDSYNFSLQHIDKILFKKYFVVQDGMYFDAIYHAIARCDGVFVGGTLDPYDSLKGWKWDTASHWIEHAHEIGLPCHIGRVGRLKGYFKAYDLGADSVDGSGIMRNGKLNRVKEFQELLRGREQFDFRYENLARSIIPSDELEERSSEQR